MGEGNSKKYLKFRFY